MYADDNVLMAKSEQYSISNIYSSGEMYCKNGS